jgi:uncharacterized membrane protein YhhN
MNILKYFAKLREERRELALLEWTYLAMAVVSVLIAGVFALFNQSIGMGMLIVPLVAFIAMSMNIVAWALIRLAMETWLPKRKSSKKSK